MGDKNFRSEESPANVVGCRHIWRFAPLLLLFFVGTICAAQTVKIRLVNTADGRPIKGQRILISGINGKTNRPERELLAKHALADLRVVSNAKGEAAFKLPRPSPSYFYVRVQLSVPVWDCICLVRVDTEEMMRNGLQINNAQDERSPGKFKTHQVPGEILFRLRPTPWWIRLLWPLMKE